MSRVGTKEGEGGRKEKVKEKYQGKEEKERRKNEKERREERRKPGQFFPIVLFFSKFNSCPLINNFVKRVFFI